MRSNWLRLFTIALYVLPAAAYGESRDGETSTGVVTDAPAGATAASRLVSESVRIGELQQPDQQQLDWEARYDAAKRRKSAGKLWLLAGAGGIGGGIAMMYRAGAQFDNCWNNLGRSGRGGVCVEDLRPGIAMMAGGISGLGWGLLRYRNGDRAMRQLEAERALMDTATSVEVGLVPLGDGHRLALAAGNRMTLEYRVSW